MALQGRFGCCWFFQGEQWSLGSIVNGRAAVKCLADSKATRLLMEGRECPVMGKGSIPKIKSYACLFFWWLLLPQYPKECRSTCNSRNTPRELLVWDWKNNLSYSPAQSWQPQRPETLLLVVRVLQALSPECQQFHFLPGFCQNVPSVIPILQIEKPVSWEQWSSASSPVFDCSDFRKHVGLPSCSLLGRGKAAYLSSPRRFYRKVLAGLLAFKVGSAAAENREAEKGMFPVDSTWVERILKEWPRRAQAWSWPACQDLSLCRTENVGGVEREFSDLVLVPTSIIALNSLSYDLQNLDCELLENRVSRPALAGSIVC